MLRRDCRAKRSKWKVAVNTDEDSRRRRRDKLMVKFRSCKRNAVLLYIHSDMSSKHHPRARNHHPRARKLLKGISPLVDRLLSHDDNNHLLLKVTIQISELLSTEEKPPINGDILLKAVSRFVEILKTVDLPRLQCEVVWALANIASETSKGTEVVIDLALSTLVKLLYSLNPDLREQAVFSLGVVACHSPTFRDCVLRHGVLQRLLEKLNENPNSSMLRNASWTLSIICGGIPPPSFDQVRPALKILERLLCNHDWEVLSDSCLSLSYLASGTLEEVEEVINAGVCPKLVELLRFYLTLGY